MKDARELETWRQLWVDYGFGERREDLRWARSCLIQSQNPNATLSDYLDWIDGDVDGMREREQRQLAANIALSIGMNNRAFEGDGANGT